jgi:hypothetical protein
VHVPLNLGKSIKSSEAVRSYRYLKGVFITLALHRGVNAPSNPVNSNQATWLFCPPHMGSFTLKLGIDYGHGTTLYTSHMDNLNDRGYPPWCSVTKCNTST